MICTQIIRPRNFALVMFSAEPQRFFPGAYTLLSVYPGPDRSGQVSQRTALDGPLTTQADHLLGILGAHAPELLDKGNATPNRVKYPLRALHEAVINAVVHRDFEHPDPVRVTVFSDRMEIRSLGALSSSVDKAKFLAGKAPPQWRNQALAYFF